jgi:hypothetical protein
MVAIQRRLHGLAFVHDLPKRSTQCPTNLRPIRHVGFRMGQPQCLLDGCEVGGLPGFDRPIGIATKGGPVRIGYPVVAGDNWLGLEIGLSHLR